MTRKRWNAGVVVVLTMLLSMAPMFRSGTAQADSDTVAASTKTQACATVHRVNGPKAGQHHLDLHVESVQGLLIAEGTETGVRRLLLMNSRIPADMAGVMAVNNPLLTSLHLIESTWGHETEARIDLALAEDVTVETNETPNGMAVVLRKGAETFSLNVIATPYPVVEVPKPTREQALKADLLAAAATDNEHNAQDWWRDSSRNQMKAMLRSVREAEVSAAAYDSARFAAQDEDTEEAPASEEPVVEEAESAPEEEAEVTPPPAREPQAPKSVEANRELAKQMIAAEAPPLGQAPDAAPRKVWRGDPMQQPVTIDFRDMNLINAVQILAGMAQINVVAGENLQGTVSLNLKNVPLKQAMETALRVNGLGIVEEEGIYHIKPYLEAIAADRRTEVVDIENADADEIKTTLEDVISGSEYESLISISANKTASTIIVSGPVDQIEPLVRMAKRLDVEQMVLPTVTMPIKLNYAAPEDMLAVIEGILTKDVGQVTVDQRARILVVTDIPIIVEQITALVEQLDIPAKSVAIEGLIVDVTLTDAADTGVDWLISAVQSQSRRDAAGNTGIFTGNLQELSLDSNLSIGDAAGLLNFGILSGDIDWRGVIQAEVRNNNSTLLSNPKLITVENQPATILIASEIPYVELTQTEQGGQQTSTEFKPIGTELTVTPTVTHDNHIIAKILAKESTSTQEVNGIPVEDKRQIETTPHIASGQTIYVGGLRKNNDTVSIRKVPVLGDVPVMNFLFRSNQRSETVNELLIFLTCTVMDEEAPLTTYQEERVQQVRDARIEVSAETALIHDAVYPGEMRDPAWKWRKHSK